ncbi:hypothetical protein [Micromonospora sp. C28ISP2-4]|uniref:hypothetical protein n=1 Tax=Micromonospora sp. C28ISP2-4 TaxID=3059523 RepID=UPI0026770796|nr:hypothetical protein [Micromonospora sp. C28ISP2-4]MDO3684595.1 hypothetical protein [Micromonospora sp. C28ISP2-4]
MRDLGGGHLAEGGAAAQVGREARVGGEAVEREQFAIGDEPEQVDRGGVGGRGIGGGRAGRGGVGGGHERRLPASPL